MVWFRNSIADSCSNLKRSRTELLASINSPTCKGRLLSARKLRTCSTGRLSSNTRKSVCFSSVICLPCLSVTVNTTFTSLEPILNLVISSSTGLSELGGASVFGAATFGGSAACVAGFWAAGVSGAGAGVWACGAGVGLAAGGEDDVGGANGSGVEGKGDCASAPTAHSVSSRSPAKLVRGLVPSDLI